MAIYSWVASWRFGIGLFCIYVLVMDLAKWRWHKHIERQIKKVWREGKIIHGPDL
jgi:hypothetical protein